MSEQIYSEYTYKGFKVLYNIVPGKSEDKLYKADGYVKCILNEKGPVVSRKFHTEYPTRIGVKNEIKKMLEEYIDFEWQEFYEMAR